MQIVEYEDKYLEDVKDLFTELEKYIIFICKIRTQVNEILGFFFILYFVIIIG